MKKEDAERVLCLSDSDIEDTKKDIDHLQNKIDGLELDSKNQINNLIGKVKSLKKDNKNLQKELAYVDRKIVKNEPTDDFLDKALNDCVGSFKNPENSKTALRVFVDVNGKNKISI